MILRLVLENYVPLLSSNITSIDIGSDEIVNLIIAPNGTAKSSILKQANALPAENGDFLDGRKYIEMLVHGKCYKLDSYTGKEGRHSFIIDDGPELNTGGTVTVQRKLVQQHLHINTNLAKVLSGIKEADTFCIMRPNRRKELFMELYPNDVAYAYDVFNSLKSERNSLKGAIKNLVSTLAEEKDKLSRLNALEDNGELTSRIEALEVEIKEGLLISGQLAASKLTGNSADLVDEFNSLVKRLTLNGMMKSSYKTESQLRAEIEGLKTSFDGAIGLKNHYASLVSECQTQVAEFGSTDEVDSATFHNHLEAVNKDIASVKEQLTALEYQYNQLPYFEYTSPCTKLNTITEGLIDYLNRVVDAGIPDLTGEMYNNWVTEKNTLSAEVETLEQTLSSIQHKLNHIRNAETIECPKCEHGFKQGIKPEDEQLLVEREQILSNKITGIKTNIDKLTDKIEGESSWYTSMRQLTVYLKENNHVPGLFELIKVYNIGKAESSFGSIHLVNALKTHQKLVTLNNKIKTLLEEKEALERRIEIINKANSSGALSRLKEMEDLHSHYTGFAMNISEKVKTTERELKGVVDYKNDLLRLKEVRANLLAEFNKESDVRLKRVLDNKLNEMSEEKNRLMKDIIRKASLQTVVTQIENNLHTLEKRQKVVTILMEGLCPNKGLIGKLMSDFISTVCANMNALIKEVYSGTLYIKPCSKENGDLTYEFPVVTGGRGQTKDAEDCSCGEAEILNFAFRMVMLRYHDCGFPLILDEVGVKLDEINRARFFNYINDYVNSGKCQQLWMVSHYLVQYGRFKGANMIGIKCDELTINGEINKTTIII